MVTYISFLLITSDVNYIAHHNQYGRVPDHTENLFVFALGEHCLALVGETICFIYHFFLNKIYIK